ncbi:signal peptidase I [Gemmatimonas aurantiaca]|uniref:signal peptidase I n=1 Tax=Gemmatimonas aurantiaca TaxID=173480 RepID=UPI0018D329C8|nr:signal peptidase I [Gemmatimonas aurantiaca]
MTPVNVGRRADALRAANRSRRGTGWLSRLVRRRSTNAPPIRPFRRERGSLWRVLLFAVLLAVAIRTFVVEAYRIPSRSMERTLLSGDFLLVNKLAYGAEVPVLNRRVPAMRAPQRDELVVFDWPVDPSVAFVKRLVGMPGDTVAMAAGVFVRNGTPQSEQWVFRGGDADPGPQDLQEGSARRDWGPLVVPPRHYFVLGDNRDNSLDSRAWGFVPDSLLRGAPLFVYYSFEPDSTVRAPWLTRIRWHRLGAAVH